MMINLPNSGKEAVLRYKDADLQVIHSGSYVRCAVTGRPIPLDDLKYWSVDRQEAYIDCEASFQAEKAAAAKKD
ncbi:hypothetical protein SAMN04488056_103199 [Cohaesibacter marisflavi]|uniref:DUF2093 domain-containing protein n=1 Tax=Cohaesibacter marisflavi TaxID=655353 RepID=A0A1I5EIF1_9HYPH|nr:hypothetical protein SAMN04488056_103199 [Cohaesibacter marisflavi]